MQTYPLTFEEPDSLDCYLKNLGLLIRRQSANRDILGKRPLDPQEHKVYDILYRRIHSQLKQKEQDAQMDGEALVRQALNVMGERGLLDSWLLPPSIMGVPYKWFIVNAFICLIAFVLTNNTNVVFFLAPVIHAVGYIGCIPFMRRQRKENMEKILGTSSQL